MGFGLLQVRGRNLVPLPPAMMTAFMEQHSFAKFYCANNTVLPVAASLCTRS